VRVDAADLIVLLQRPEPAHYLAKRGTPPKKVREGSLHADARDLRLQAEGDVGEVVVQSVWRMRKARKTEAGAIAAGSMPMRPPGGGGCW